MRATHMPNASSAFDTALYLAQKCGGSHSCRLINEHGARIASTAKAIARALGVPIDEHEDVAQETVRRLLDPECGRFDPNRGSAKQYVRCIARNAVGFASRRRRALRMVGPKEGAGGVTRRHTEDMDWHRPFQRVEARLIAVALLGRANDRVRQGAYLVYGQDMSQRDAAHEMGISEFKLSRMFTAFYADARIAA